MKHCEHRKAGRGRSYGVRCAASGAAGPRLLLALGVILAAALQACEARESTSLQPRLTDKAADQVVPVETLALKVQSFEDAFWAPGLIEAKDEVTVSAEIAGRIESIGFEIGDEVNEGDLLVAVNDDTIRARIHKIEAQVERPKTLLRAAKKDLEREKRLFETEVGAEKAFDDATRDVETYQTDLAALEADLELAMVELKKTKIDSPVSGSVARRHVAAGEYVTPGDDLYDLVVTHQVKFVIALSERDVTKVNKGDRVQLRIDAYPSRKFEGKVTSVAPSGNPRTRTFRIELLLDNSGEERLRPRMSGRARIVRDVYDNVFLIPEESILRSDERNYVYLADGDRARQGDVKIVASVGARAVISSELGSDSDCIILGQYAVRPDSEIYVRRRHEEIPELIFD